MNPRLCNWLPADENDNGRLSGRFHGFDEVQLCPNKTEIRHIDMFARRRVGPWGPQECLVKGPSTDHDDSDIRVFGSGHCVGEAGLVVRPELAALSKINLRRSVGNELLEACEGTNAIVCGVEEDIVSELSPE